MSEAVGRDPAKGIELILIISGSRGYHRDEYLPLLSKAIDLSGFNPTKILHGANMESVDRLAREYAILHGLPCEGVPADWEGVMRQGLPRGAAGPIRNGILERRGHALVAMWDGETPGTADMIQKMKRAQKPAFVYRLDGAPHERFPVQLGLFPAPAPRR